MYDKATADVKTPVALCRLAGLRRGDAVTLRWSDANFEDGGLIFRPQKIERSVKADARVPICGELMKILKELRATRLRLDGRVAGPGAPPNINDHQFPRLCKPAGVEPWSKPLHTLRKSCIDD